MKALLPLLFVSSLAQAGELIVHVGSQHGRDTYVHTHTDNIVDPGTGNVVVRVVTQVRKPYNNFNPGIGYRFDNEMGVGIYVNSYEKTSVYAAFMPLWPTPIEDLKVGGVLMAVTGYEQQTGNKLSIGGSLAARYQLTKDYSAYLLYMPKTSADASSVAHLMFGKGF